MLNVENDNIKPENGNITPSEVDLKRANIIADTFVEKVETAAPVRIATSVDEKKGAVKIRELYEKILGLPARTEPTTVAPLAGRFGIPVYGVIFAIALAFYIVGVLIDDKAVAYGFLALSMLVTVFVGAMLFVQVLTNKNTFNALFPKRTSYNVLSSIEAKAPAENTLVIGSHYDSDMDRSDAVMFLKDKNLPKWISRAFKALSIISIPVLLVFEIIAICLPHLNVGDKAVMFLFPTIFCGLAIFYLVTMFSYKKRNSNIGHEGLQAAGVSLAVADYLRLHPELIPDNTKVVLACFGAKECGAKGAEQLILQHYGRDESLINPVVINFSKVGDCDNVVIQGDRQYKNIYDLKINNVAFKAIKEVCDDVAFRYSETLFTDSTPFARRKIPTTTIELKKGDNELSSAYDRAFKSALNVTVDTMKYMQERQQLFRGEKTIM